ncbi:hypothetical protein BBJ28_00010916 [Nothophytophthora sp. Chile5]|nr:hypothetical protein BBJ28_00010916 [Nothophytophthora sp. Chile5]
MVSLRNVLITFVASALALQEFATAAPCGEADYSTVKSAVQSLNANCASWAVYVASGDVWHCDSTCYQSAAKFVDTLPDCEFGELYGQNYREVVEGMITNCEAELASSGPTDEATSNNEQQQRSLRATPVHPTSGGTASTTSSANKQLESTVALVVVTLGVAIVLLQ